ncbi:hypothetical protein RhiirB3_447655 [Rhizophagus irregularis]|nr:hypothetical protein RhiirB3_447655 [Rhizophagus irregularis]
MALNWCTVLSGKASISGRKEHLWILVSKNMDFSLEHKTQISVFKNTGTFQFFIIQISVSKNTGMCIETSSFEIYFEETWIQFLRIQVRV